MCMKVANSSRPYLPNSGNGSVNRVLYHIFLDLLDLRSINLSSSFFSLESRHSVR